jgi:hypothetical protein
VQGTELFVSTYCLLGCTYGYLCLLPNMLCRVRSCLLRPIVSYGVLTALDAVVVSSAARIATRRRRLERPVAMLLNRAAVNRTMSGFRVALWNSSYVAPVHCFCQIDMIAGGRCGRGNMSLQSLQLRDEKETSNKTDSIYQQHSVHRRRAHLKEELRLMAL